MFTLPDGALHFKAASMFWTSALRLAGAKAAAERRRRPSEGEFRWPELLRRSRSGKAFGFCHPLEMVVRFEPVENEAVWTALACRVSALPHLGLYLWCIRLVFSQFALQNSPSGSSFLETAPSY